MKVISDEELKKVIRIKLLKDNVFKNIAPALIQLFDGCIDETPSAEYTFEEAFQNTVCEQCKKGYGDGYETGYGDAILEVEELCQRKRKLFGEDKK